MVKKPKNRGVVIAVVLVLLLAGVYLTMSSQSRQQAIFSEDLDSYVYVEVKETNLLSRLLSTTEQAFFSRTQITVGDIVTVRQFLSRAVTDKDEISEAALVIKRVSGDIRFDVAKFNIGPLILDDQDQTVSHNYRPNREGQYEADVIIIYTDGSSGVFPATNRLVVNPVDEPCDKNNFYESWEVVQNINGGVREARWFNKVSDDCEHFRDYQEERTVCDSGYKIVGSTATAADGFKSCEKIEDADPECTQDKTVQCDDGSTIISAACIDGQWANSNEKCPDIGGQTGVECTNDVTQECKDGTSVLLISCDNGVRTLVNEQCSAESGGPKTDETTGSDNVLEFSDNIKGLLYIIGGIVFLVLIVGGIIRLRR